MPVPVVAAPVPTVAPAVPAKTFDRYHMLQLLVTCPDPNGPAVGEITVRKGLVDLKTGLWELSPNDPPQKLRKDDLLTLAATDPLLAQALGAVLMYTANWVSRPMPEGLTPPPPEAPQP